MGAGASAEQKEAFGKAMAPVRSVVSMVSAEDLKEGVEDLLKDLPEEKKKAIAEAFRAVEAVPAEEKKDEAVFVEQKKGEAVSAEEKKEEAAPAEKILEDAIRHAQAAEKALDMLDKRDFPDVGHIANPKLTCPAELPMVLEVCMHLQAGINSDIAVDKRGRVKDTGPSGAKQMMWSPENFVHHLKKFKSDIDEGNVPQQNVDRAKKIITSVADFSPEVIRKKSWKDGFMTPKAAAAVCDWILNIVAYYDLVLSVAKPAPQAD